MTSEDPFTSHFAHPDDNELSRKLASIQKKQWHAHNQSAENFGKIISYFPESGLSTSNDPKSAKRRRGFDSPHDLGLKRRLSGPAKEVIPELDELQSCLGLHLFDYRDLIFPARTHQNAASLRKITCLHALNHIFKTRDRVLKNTEKVASDGGRHGDLELRDQGFTRPKVLVILPTRGTCVRYVETIASLCAPEQQENKKRFEDAFLAEEDDTSDAKPEDHQETFEGNKDDNFKLGIKFTRKTIKYYSPFYTSDVIFASPLGLRQAIDGKDPKKADYDFLSSIEILIIDKAGALLMQNWEHTKYVLDVLNRQPREPHGCDFSRVRQWYLDGNARFLRQTIVFSAYLTPELNGLFSSSMENVAGKVKIQPEYSGALQEVGDMKLLQSFSRFNSSSWVTDPDDRFSHFTKSVVTALEKQAGQSKLGALIFIPSYFDFLRIRQFFASDSNALNITWGSISESDEISDIHRARSHFLTGRTSLLLYSGRLHFYYRYMIKGVKQVVLYAPPENPLFYTELVGGMLHNSVEEGKIRRGDARVQTLFSKWDVLSLERIVGTANVRKMLQDGANDIFHFR